MTTDPLAVLISFDYLKRSAYQYNKKSERNIEFTYVFYNRGANCIKIELVNFSECEPTKYYPYVFLNNMLTNIKAVHELEMLEKFLLD